MLKIEGLVKKKIRIYGTYKNTVMPHGRNISAVLSVPLAINLIGITKHRHFLMRGLQ